MTHTNNQTISQECSDVASETEFEYLHTCRWSRLCSSSGCCQRVGAARWSHLGRTTTPWTQTGPGGTWREEKVTLTHWFKNRKKKFHKPVSDINYWELAQTMFSVFLNQIFFILQSQVGWAIILCFPFHRIISWLKSVYCDEQMYVAFLRWYNRVNRWHCPLN